MSLPSIQPEAMLAACCSHPWDGLKPGEPPRSRTVVTTTLLVLGLASWTAAYAVIQPLSEWLALRAFGLARESHLGQSVAFFLYDTPKVLRPPLIAAFVGVVDAGIPLVGWPFNSVL